MGPGPVIGALVAAPVALAFVAAVAVLANRRPAYVLALAAAAAFSFSPRLCRGALIVGVFVAPTVNPAVLGVGAGGGGTIAGGRIYLLQGTLLLILLGAVAVAARTGMHTAALKLVGLGLLLVAVETVGRPHAGMAWIYRPLQVFFTAFAVRALFGRVGDRGLLLALAWGSALGCALASLNALMPDIDPFVLSRPSNLPFVSAIGGFVRATGAFTYPNNLGTFAAYTFILGAAAWLFGRPRLPQVLAVALMVTGGSALYLSGSRAAGLGLVAGSLYVTVRAAPRRRVLMVLAELTAGLFLVFAVLSSPTAREVAQERIESSSGESLTLRVEGIRESLRVFRAAPLFGPGASESRTDNFWVLNLAEGGLAGAAILLLLARLTLTSGRPKRYPELWGGLLITLCVSGLLQDSLGQTLTTWFLGALAGVALLAPGPAAAAEAVGAEAVGAETVGAEAVGAEVVGAEAAGVEPPAAEVVGAEPPAL